MTSSTTLHDAGEAPATARATGGAASSPAEGQGAAISAGQAPHPDAAQDAAHPVTDTAAGEPPHGGYVHNMQ